MKMPTIKRNFPLVALVLFAIALLSVVSGVHHTSQAMRLISTEEKLKVGWVQRPEATQFDDDDYDKPVPELTPVEPWLSKQLKVIEIPPEALGEKNSEFVYGKIRIKDQQYIIDFNHEDAKYVTLTQGQKTTFVLAKSVPIIIRDFAVFIVSLLLALALLASRKSGYIHKRNILFIRVSATVIGIAIVAPFISKAVFYYVYLEGVPELTSLMLRGSVIPGLLVLAAVIGLSHLVCQSMRNAMKMKEEIDATV